MTKIRRIVLTILAVAAAAALTLTASVIADHIGQRMTVLGVMGLSLIAITSYAIYELIRA